MLKSDWFSYDGRNSIDFDLMNINIGFGKMIENVFLPNRQIQEISIDGNEKPYFHKVKRDPIILKLSFAFRDTFDNDMLKKVKHWLNQDYYKPLMFSSDPERIYYAMCIDDTTIFDTGFDQGYIDLTMRCDSPYAYTPFYSTNDLDFSINPKGRLYGFYNRGDYDCNPEIWIKKVGDGDVSIYNLTDANREFKFTGLKNNEMIYINNETEEIVTDVPNTYRYDNFNDNYLRLKYGLNRLMIFGNCILRFRYQFRLN